MSNWRPPRIIQRATNKLKDTPQYRAKLVDAIRIAQIISLLDLSELYPVVRMGEGYHFTIRRMPSNPGSMASLSMWANSLAALLPVKLMGFQRNPDQSWIVLFDVHTDEVRKAWLRLTEATPEIYDKFLRHSNVETMEMILKLYDPGGDHPLDLQGLDEVPTTTELPAEGEDHEDT